MTLDVRRLKAADLVNSIAQIGVQRVLDYYTGNTKLKIIEVTKPEGPIK